MSHRLQITLTDQQHAHLLEESRRRGISLHELVREALVGSYVQGPPDMDNVARALDESFGAWSHRSFDGASYVNTIRRGMRRHPDA